MAKDLDLHVGLICLVPFAFLLKESIAGGAPRIGPLIFISGFSREPLLSWICNQMFADKRLKTGPVRCAIQLLQLRRGSLWNERHRRINDIDGAILSRASISSLCAEKLCR